MIKVSIASLLSLSLAAIVPQPSQADIKDVLIGGAIGAMVNQSINNENKKKKKTVQRAASLNSQYTRAERVQIQTSLNQRGINVGTVDGSLGPKSRSGIAAFQASIGQNATGQLTREQFAALTNQGFGNATAAVAERQLTQNEFAMLQQGLQAAGYYNGPVTGFDSPQLENARIAYVASQGQNPMQITKIQTLVMAGLAAGYPVPAYLQQEAQAQYAAAQPLGFGQPAAPGFGNAAAAQPQGFGAPQQQNAAAFGAQPQAVQPGAQQQQVFAPNQAPAQTFGAAPAPQPVANPAATAPAAAPAQTVQPLFPQQPQQQVAPQPTTPQPAAPQGGQMVQNPAPQQPQSTLDVFTATAPAAQPQAAETTQPVLVQAPAATVDPNATAQTSTATNN